MIRLPQLQPSPRTHAHISGRYIIHFGDDVLAALPVGFALGFGRSHNGEEFAGVAADLFHLV
jgi:hypothetical protein